MFIDSHCHFDFSQFDLDREHIIKQCSQLEVNKILVPGTRFSHFQNQLDLAGQYPQLLNAFGMHPFFLDSFVPAHLEELTLLLKQHRETVVAVGEIGLDKTVDIDWDLQMKVFEQQVLIARSLKLPLILHHRKSHNEILAVLKAYKFDFGGIVHAFSGSGQIAKCYIDLGFAIGVGGTITYPRARKTRDTIKSIPLSSIVLETDAPDMPLNGDFSARNSPENIPKIFETLVTLRAEPREKIKLACVNNVRQHLVNI